MQPPDIPGLEFEAAMPWPALGMCYRAVWDVHGDSVSAPHAVGGEPSPADSEPAAMLRRRDVVAQVLPADLSRDAEFRHRFFHQGPQIIGVRHRNLVRVIHGDEGGGRLFLLYNLTGPLESLAERVLRADFLTPEVVRMMALEIATGLDALHRHGTVHGDVCPENVLFIPGGIQLADLGLARLQPVGRAPKLLLGFVAPEQAGGDPRADDRTDVYRLGATLFFALTGQPPFPGDSFDAVCFNVLEEALIWPAVPRVPGAYKRIVERCLVKDPSLRYTNIGALKRDLEALSPVGPVSSGRLNRAWPRMQGTTRQLLEPGHGMDDARGRLSPRVWLLVAVWVVAIATAVAWLLGAFQ